MIEPEDLLGDKLAQHQNERPSKYAEEIHSLTRRAGQELAFAGITAT